MSYTDRLMSTGERITLRDRQHWFVVLAAGRYAVAALVLAILILVVQLVAAPSEPLAGILGIVAAVLFVAGLAFLGWEILRYVNQEYIITTRRVIQVSGVINKRSADSSLEKINDADLSQSLFGRMFNFGDLDVLTASEAGIDQFRMIHDPVVFKRAMLDAKHEYEQDMGRGPGSAGPPLRAAVEHRASPDADAERFAEDLDDTTSTPVGRAPADLAPAAVAPPPVVPVPAPPLSPVAPPTMTAEEVTRTLASLADLRDRGALSEDEFERKKADLLGRL
jgi:hypothetical protein